MARQRLKEAWGALTANDRSAFWPRPAQAMTDLPAGKLDIPEARVERATVQERLGDRPDAAALTDRAMTLIEACELARFRAGRGPSQKGTIRTGPCTWCGTWEETPLA